MYQIHIGPLNFFAYHGIHEEEKILGNHFEVILQATASCPDKFEQLSDAVDYVLISAIIRKHMNRPTDLLETIADNICHDIFQNENRIKEIQIQIRKLHPPVMGIHGSVGISLTKTAPL